MNLWFARGAKTVSRSKDDVATKKIAVIISHHKNVWDIEVTQSFIASLRERLGLKKTPDIDIFAAKGDESSLVDEILPPLLDEESGYVALVTVGVWTSQVVRDVLDQSESLVPQVFVGVDRPAQRGLVNSLDFPGQRVTGVTRVKRGAATMLRKLQALLPSIKTILFVSGDDQSLISDDEKELIVLSESYGITAKQCLVQPDKQAPECVRSALLSTKIDAICMMSSVHVEKDLDALIALCQEERVPLCATNLSAVVCGAALGFGDKGASYGPYAASIVYDMLTSNRVANKIPVISLSHDARMCFNKEAMNKQGVVLTKEAQELLSITSVFY